MRRDNDGRSAGWAARARAAAGALALALCGSLAVSAQTPAQTSAQKPGAGSFYGDPAHPDLSGIWNAGAITSWSDSPPPWPLTPAYRKKLDKTRALVDAGKPEADSVSECKAFGMPRILSMPFYVFQMPGIVLMIAPVLHEVRTIYTDRPEANDTDWSYGGTSTGHWEGDTLVVDTLRINANTNDPYGVPHSDKLTTHERLRRIDANTLEDEVTLTDPEAYTRPWTRTLRYHLMPASARMDEYICAENNRNQTLPDGTQGAQ